MGEAGISEPGEVFRQSRGVNPYRKLSLGGRHTRRRKTKDLSDPLGDLRSQSPLPALEHGEIGLGNTEARGRVDLAPCLSTPRLAKLTALHEQEYYHIGVIFQREARRAEIR